MEFDFNSHDLLFLNFDMSSHAQDMSEPAQSLSCHPITVGFRRKGNNRHSKGIEVVTDSNKNTIDLYFRTIGKSVTVKRKQEERTNLLLLGGNGAGVDVQAAVTNDLLDLALLFKVGKSLASQATVNLETINKGGDGDQAVGLDILV